jgi:hypothetical protein
MTLDDLMALVHVTDSGCWEWQGKIDARGRLICRMGSRCCKDANRIAYGLIHNAEVPIKLTRACDNPKCVLHWEGSVRSREPAPPPRRRESDLTPEEVAAFMSLWRQGIKATRLMQRFRLTACALSRLVERAQGFGRAA